MASTLVAMASNLLAMASTLVAMASNLLAMASNLVAMASNLYLRHPRCGQHPPQGHPNTTLLEFRVALRCRAGLSFFIASTHGAEVAETKRGRVGRRTKKGVAAEHEKEEKRRGGSF